MSFRCSDDENLQAKFTRLLETAGLAALDLSGKFVAIKMHFGEPGCLAYLRPIGPERWWISFAPGAGVLS